MEGKAPSEVQIQQAEFGCCNKCCCNKCKNSIVDFHRSCQQCSYKLCLSCCQELQKCPTRMKSSELVGNQLLERNQIQKPKQKCDILSLPSSESFPVGKCGGCGHGFLELRSVFPLNWTKDLETSAEEIICCYDFPDTLDTSPSCSLCIPSDNKASGNKLVEAATREDPNDNFLYRTSVQDIDRDNLEHFQKHWAKGHPVIIRNVIRSSSELSWDPIVMFCTYLEKSIAKSENNYKAVRANGCLDWCEVEIGIRKIFSGSLEGQTNANMQHEMLKLKGWLSSHLFQEHFPAHYAEIVRVLPLQEYLNPDSGLLNLTANFPQELPQADCGPCIYISYGCSEEHIRSDSVTKLCYDSHDVVNILAHTADVPLSGAQFSKIKKLMKKYKARDQRKRTKTTSGWKISNKTKQKSLFPNQNLEAKWQDIIGGGTNLHQKDAVEEVFDSSVKNGTITHSDAYDSDSEATVLRGETSGSSSEDEESCSGHIGESNWFGNKPVADNTLGAQWDVFRRQDVPKLVEYLRRHSNEFRHSYGFPKHVVHPLLDKIFFLDTTDKLRLKEEFKIEPWSFVQHLGEAVIIPAGCPYQIKNLKSCINVVLEFVSPENVTECIQLIDELRLLPDHHKAKKGKLEVQKLSLYSISAAITEIRKLTSAEQS